MGRDSQKTTETLEGDGPVVIRVFELMEALRSQVNSPTFPSAIALIRTLREHTPFTNESLAHPFAKAKEYFLENLPDMKVYLAAELLDPLKVHTVFLFFF